METDLEELKEQIELLFNPEPDEFAPGPRDFPHPTLEKVHKLDLAYLRSIDWEGASMHHYTRLAGPDDDLDRLTRNLDMPERLMASALRLFSDSIIAYAKANPREGEIRFYPAIVLTFWSGFETFVRHSSEMLLLTVRDLPAPVRHFLRETENVVEPGGAIKTRTRFQPVLDRYSVFIFHAYGLRIDRGSLNWQNLKKAQGLRDYYTHLDVNQPRAITTADVAQFMESVLLGLIWPSSLLQRTFMMGQYFLYHIWHELREYAEDYRERPFFMDWHLKEVHLFHCNFENVDPERFPSSVGNKEYFEKLKARRRSNEDGSGR